MTNKMGSKIRDLGGTNGRCHGKNDLIPPIISQSGSGGYYFIGEKGNGNTAVSKNGNSPQLPQIVTKRYYMNIINRSNVILPAISNSV